jgi:hypothetical protein
MQCTANPASAIGSIAAATCLWTQGVSKMFHLALQPLDGGAGENRLALSPPIALESYMMALTCRQYGVVTCPTLPFLCQNGANSSLSLFISNLTGAPSPI